MRFSKSYAAIAIAALGAGIFTSCSNEMNDIPNLGVNSPKLLRAPEVRAWSGSHSFGTGSRGEVISEYYEAMPDFSEWIAEWRPENFSEMCPAVPSDAETITPAQYKDGGVYLLDSNGGGEFFLLNDINADNVTVYVKGQWDVYVDGEYDKNVTFIILGDADTESYVTFSRWDEQPYLLKNVHIYNYGSLYIYDDEETINKGTRIYNAGEMVVEQNYVDDNSDLSLDPIRITEPIYSTGECYFKGGVGINTDEAYFKKVCVDGQMTVREGKSVNVGYLNCDELYGHENSRVVLAPEGMVVAGTISMRASAKVVGNSESNGFITTNEIIGINKTNGTIGSKMESEVSKDNFATIFSNVDIYVTTTINNTQNYDEILTYKAANGITYPLNAKEFDASENDDVREGSVNDWTCGIGYKYVRKHQKEEPKVEPENPEPETPDSTDDETTTVNHDNEVEINLSLNDSHSNYTQEDLVSKLSIHVRYAGDVEVFIPVPRGYYCEADDFNLREGLLYVPGENQSFSFEINGNTVTLTVQMEDGGIRVTTDGINQDVLDFCMENYGDGVNFEVFNYYGLYELDAEGNYVRAEDGNIARETILELLNNATVKFLDTPGPDYYINAFQANKEGEGDHDCTVSIVDEQAATYDHDYVGSHLNSSDYNHIYCHEGVSEHTHATE